MIVLHARVGQPACVEAGCLDGRNLVVARLFKIVERGSILKICIRSLNEGILGDQAMIAEQHELRLGERRRQHDGEYHQAWQHD